jgi:ABC-2 type transport system ATP-binding protein
VIEAVDVNVDFRTGPFRRSKIRARDGFNLHVERGDVFALLGPNGAGKSTAMYCFLGLIRPNRGHIKVLGLRPLAGGSRFQRIAYLPEEPHYHLYLTVEEAVTYYGNLYLNGVTRARVDEVIELVGLTPYRSLSLGKCSKGMRQKAGIAACLLRDVDLMFLDEPTRGLDPEMVKSFRNTLRDLNARGTTIVINSHLLSEIELLCNRVAIIDRGRVLAQEELSKLLKVDLDWFVVEIEAPEEIPEFLVDGERINGVLRARVRAEMLGDFLTFTRDHELEVHSCAHKRLTLEEAFVSVLDDHR